jgi:transposase
MAYTIEQKIGKHIYLYEVQSYWDKEKKQPRQKRRYLGKKDDKTGKVVKSRSCSTPYLSKDYGNIYFLDKISEKIGLKEVLKEIFPDDYNELLNLSYYELSESKPFYLYNYWEDITFCKDVRSMNSQDISRFMKRMGNMEKQRQEFTKMWVKRYRAVKTVVFDITSLSSYSELIEIMEWGYNRDLEKLPQINLGVVFDENSKMPLHYQIYPGSIHDVSTLSNTLKYLELYGLKDIIFVLDRGFYSAHNIKEMNKNKISFISPMPFSVKIASALVSKNNTKLNNTENAFVFKKDLLFHVQEKIFINDVSLSAHIYYNDKKACEEKSRFLKNIIELEEKTSKKEFPDKTAVKGFLSSCYRGSDNIFNVTVKEKKALLERKDKSIAKLISKMGNMIILTNEHSLKKDEILFLYRRKDYLEKMFDILKNELDGKRLRVHSKKAIEGKLFVKFITLILYSAIYNTMRDKNLFKIYSVKEIIFELKKLRTVEMLNGKSYLTEVSKKQRNIFETFNINVPINT